MKLQEKLQSKGFTTGFDKAAVLRPEEAAIFANSQLSRQNITDMKSNVERMKESLKKAASERKGARDADSTKIKMEGGTSLQMPTDTAIKKERKSAFEYIPG
jgi:NADH dehydrogenase/NADH:ubiquinone oxidoreductase subunit G